MTNGPQIPEWLAGASFEELFLRNTRRTPDPDETSSLIAVVNSDEAPSKSRVLAHELLLDAGYSTNASLLEAYCATLPDVFPHNAWGMPGHYTERLGKTLVSFGEAAIPCLVGHFDDERRLSFFGSEEPSLSATMGYRVKDLAAYLASLIAGIRYDDAPDRASRDDFIRELKRNLGQ
jgi:hypothetical protein